MGSVLIVGCGSMGSSLATGIIEKSKQGLELDIFDIHSSKIKSFKEQNITGNVNFNFYETPPKGKNYEIVFLCVKPNNLLDIAPWFHGITGSQTTVVSILAGKTLSDIQQELSLDCNIARAMPNINAISKHAATAICYTDKVSDDKRRQVEDLLSGMGTVTSVTEDRMDAVTGLSGSGPAYIFMAIEALVDGGVKMGLPRQTSFDLVVQTIKGACETVLQTKDHPAVLKDKVTTPGGTTIHALHELEAAGLRSILMSAVESATIQSQKLGQKK